MESPYRTRRQPVRQRLDDLLAVSGPILATLLLLDDAPADLKLVWT